jgi:predicted secreted hydrolase
MDRVGRRPWLVLLLCMLAAACTACSQERAEEPAAPAIGTGLRLLGGEAGAGFARALQPREFVFPRDHASHPEYRTEWWYFTGNLATPMGRHFGFELTFFRYALAPPGGVLEEASAWRTSQVWMAHLAVTDTAGQRFSARERLSRDGLDLAGATAQPLRIWLKDWEAAGIGEGDELDLRLRAQDDDMGLALRLTSTGPAVPHGDGGLDAKGPGFGNASYYYSVPRLEAAGEITIAGQSFPVSGLAWLDREWSTSALDPGIEGWDWFALHLSDGSSLMFYRLRTASGGSSPYSGGTLVRANGERLSLGASDVTLEVLDYWTSDASAVRYPVAWRLLAPKADLALTIEPYLDHQELVLSVRYWEGAVRVSGTGPTGPIEGAGYLELAGY